VRVRALVRRGAAVMSVAAFATAGLVLAVGASAGAASVEKTFDEEGQHDYVVPEGVCFVWIDADGASGGDAIETGEDDEEPATNPGGDGGHAKARVTVTPGEQLFVFVGGEGEDAVDTVPGEGGFNGGGDGGVGDPNEEGAAGGGGGGGSDVRQGGIDLSDRIVVGGGGGGAGGGNPEEVDPGVFFGGGGAGGDGGGEEGDDGEPSGGAVETQAGEGGSQDEGGDGGVVDPGGSNRNGDDGELGEGGDGGFFDPAEFVADGGGGGGGGLYGGGGGASGRSDTAEEFPDGAGGGGGSGWVPEGGELETGENEDDDGQVTISYDPVTDACAAEAEAIEIEPKFTG
jgi:Glycine rich protein